MNFPGISPPSPTVAVPVSYDAPMRPGQWRLLARVGFALPFAFLALFSNFHPVFVGLAFVGLPLCIVAPLVLWRRYERTGWYVHRETTRPDLPYEMRYGGDRVVFGTEDITFSGVLTKTQSITYAEIVLVSVDCAGDCLQGVMVSRMTKGYHSASEPKPPKSWFMVSGAGQGAQACTALVILRDKAPQAVFRGPQWIEEGWVPRMGFTYPLTD